jgi:hypothetical protein
MHQAVWVIGLSSIVSAAKLKGKREVKVRDRSHLG